MGAHHSHRRGRGGTHCKECREAYTVDEDVAYVHTQWSNYRSSTKTLEEYVVEVYGYAGIPSWLTRFLGFLGRAEGGLIYSTTEKFVREGRCFDCAFKTAIIVCDSGSC